MARFSLSPPHKPHPLRSPPPSPPTEFQYKFPPRDPSESAPEQDEWYDDSDSSSEESSSEDASDESSCGSISDEEEPPHPLGFERYGRTRFGLSPRCVPPDPSAAPLHIIGYETPLKNRLYHDGISSASLLDGITDRDERKSDADGMDRIANLLKAASMNDSSLTTQRLYRPAANDRLLQLARAAQQFQSHTLPAQMKRLEVERSNAHQNAVDGLLALLSAEASRVAQAEERTELRARRRRREEEEATVREKRREEAERLAKEEELEAERSRKERAEESRREEEERERRRSERARLAEEEAAKEALLQNAHVERAKGLLSSLDALRSALRGFDSSKSVSKRRLGFKKIVNGKINTLSREGNKIREVAGAVVDALRSAQRDDEAGTDEVSKLGERYLLDLLASNLIVRVQADGFNGTRGDGFPLASCFAMISTQCGELNDLVEGHLYGVCPMGVPVLEMEIGDALGGMSEEDRWMESLGMIRDKNGEFETFDKFLHRTEGLISIMANIMSSLPSDHTLLGGHKGALTWLERFIDLLPPPPTQPLPLLTAPVLVAFLTGAGHMLANKFASKFQSLFATIQKEIMDRLDDSPAGVPSATRLKKVMESGFEGLKKNMPPGAVETLYDGSEGSGTASVTMPAGNTAGAFGSKSSSMNASPFGQAASTGASPFGQATSNTSPFGQAGSSNTSPFGQASSTNASPFGDSMADSQSSPSGPTSSTNASPFGNSMMDGDDGNQNSGWGSNAGGATSNPFSSSNSNWGRSSAFGDSTASSTSSFASSQALAPAGGFGNQTNAFQSQSNSFGGGSTTNPSPFGSQPTPSPFGATSNPFGGTATASAPAPSPFGAFSSQSQSNNPFGGGGAPSSQANNPFSGGSSSFGGGFGNAKKDSRPPCKFFAKGSCRYGANCKFSHGDTAPGGNTNESFSSFGSSFGASGNTGGGFGKSQPSPFGSSGFGGSTFGSNPSPFTSNASSNPFGGPRR